MLIKGDEIIQEDVKKILDIVSELEIDMDVFEGSLLDNYIIYNDGEIEIDGCRPEYIILAEKYRNEWSSTTEIILTDNGSMVEKLVETWE